MEKENIRERRRSHEENTRDYCHTREHVATLPEGRPLQRYGYLHPVIKKSVIKKEGGPDGLPPNQLREVDWISSTSGSGVIIPFIAVGFVVSGTAVVITLFAVFFVVAVISLLQRLGGRLAKG